jgi:hypothetical protein
MTQHDDETPMRATEHVDAEYLARATPRPLPLAALPGLVAACLLERPRRALLDPALLAALATLLLLAALRASWPLLALPLALAAWRLWREARRVAAQLRDELALLRHGRVVQAHILKHRPHRDALGEIDGALLYCAIPVAQRRTYVGTVWLSDGTEALRLVKAGRTRVICLPRAPGTWRIAEDLQSELRYDLKQPAPELPADR